MKWLKQDVRRFHKLPTNAKLGILLIIVLLLIAGLLIGTYVAG